MQHVLSLYEHVQTIHGEAQTVAERLQQASDRALRPKIGDKGVVSWESISSVAFLAHFQRMWLGLELTGTLAPGAGEASTTVTVRLALPKVGVGVTLLFATASLWLTVRYPHREIIVFVLGSWLYWGLCLLVSRRSAIDFVERRLMPELEGPLHQ